MGAICPNRKKYLLLTYAYTDYMIDLPPNRRSILPFILRTDSFNGFKGCSPAANIPFEFFTSSETNSLGAYATDDLSLSSIHAAKNILMVGQAFASFLAKLTSTLQEKPLRNCKNRCQSNKYACLRLIFFIYICHHGVPWIAAQPLPNALRYEQTTQNIMAFQVATTRLKNQPFIDLLHEIATLLALHDANPFQVKHYTHAARFIAQFDQEIIQLDATALKKLPGITKGLIALIEEFSTTGTLQRWQELISQTPPRLLEILQLPGLGPKKVRTLWQTLGIKNIEQLAIACKEGRVAHLSGFGEKTQATILSAIQQASVYRHQFHYATACTRAHHFESAFRTTFPNLLLAATGAFRRKVATITTLEYLIGTTDPSPMIEWLHHWEPIVHDPFTSGPFSWRGHFKENQLPLSILVCKPTAFYQQLILQTGSSQHLALEIGDTTLGKIITQHPSLTSEAAGYKQAGIPYVPVELREGITETTWIKEGAPALIETHDLQGIFHIHTKYSDGKDTLEDMATYCKNMGYHYIGITDHSQSAAYAGGLRPPTVKEQHQVIDQLNQQLAPFRVFKGIEADILPNGNLDYTNDILATFDFVIASVHMGLHMDQKKATDRLIKAISNPFTTMLGHPTGRLLLKREGYPIDYPAVIDACAAYDVIIEINTNPWRLELDWQWIPYALQKGVKISINPDAHHHTEIGNLPYGTYIGRKGGLTKTHTFNSLTLKAKEMKKWQHAITFLGFLPLLLLINLLPFSLLYKFSDVCFYVLYHGIRYRRKVVWHNLCQAFPEKTIDERLQIQHDFYKHLADLLVEQIKGLSITPTQAIRRCTFKNPEVLTTFHKQGKHVILLAGHQGNWEWAGNTIALQSPYPLNVLYQPLSNPYFDKLVGYIRQRFHRRTIPHHQIIKTLLDYQKIPQATAILADQAPHTQPAYFTTFLNQPTYFNQTVEKLARKLNHPLLYIRILKVRRGHYHIYAETLCEQPTTAPLHSITQQYVQKLNDHILQQPATWLWSHRRWKALPTH
eukprot:gene32-45_t